VYSIVDDGLRSEEIELKNKEHMLLPSDEALHATVLQERCIHEHTIFYRRKNEVYTKKYYRFVFFYLKYSFCVQFICMNRENKERKIN